VSYEKKAMTTFAQQALAISDLVGMKFRSTRLAGAIPRSVQVKPPMMESTGGGKQARESVVLVAENGDTAQNIVAGFVDVKLRAVEMRTYPALSALHRARFKMALDLSQPDYDRFLAEAKEFFESEGFIFKTSDESPAPQRGSTEAAMQRPSSGMGLYIGLGVVALGAAAAAAWFMLK
jgi:hypothetical protein